MPDLTQLEYSYTPTEEERPYQPYGAALALFYDQSLEVVLEGPAGTGKSRAVLEKLHFCAIKYPGCRILIVRKTRESLSESILVTYEEKVLPPGDPIAEGPNRHNRQFYEYPNGSVIIIAGLVSHGMNQRTKVMSTEYDIIAAFEATEIPQSDWENLISRLRNWKIPFQQIIGECNPDVPTHWLHRRCDSGVTVVHYSRHEDNPELFRDGTWTMKGKIYILKILEALTGARKQRLRFGRRAAVEGTVYDFIPAIHMVKAHLIKPSWRRFRIIDFGYVAPFVCLWAAVDPDLAMYVYRQLYMTGRIVREHCKTIKEYSIGEHYEATLADHDAEDRATMAAEGIPTIAADKRLSMGIQAVQARLNPGSGRRPRLYVVEDCLIEEDPELKRTGRPTRVEQEFESYLWPKGADGIIRKEVPIDENNHGLDPVRYLANYLDNRRAPSRQKNYLDGASDDG